MRNSTELQQPGMHRGQQHTGPEDGPVREEGKVAEE